MINCILYNAQALLSQKNKWLVTKEAEKVLMISTSKKQAENFEAGDMYSSNTFRRVTRPVEIL